MLGRFGPVERTERPRKSYDDRPRKEHGGWQDKPARDTRPDRPAPRDQASAAPRPEWKKRDDRPAWTDRAEKPVKPEGSWARRDAAPVDRAPTERAGDDRAPFRKGPKKPSKDKGKPDFARKADKKASRKPSGD